MYSFSLICNFNRIEFKMGFILVSPVNTPSPYQTIILERGRSFFTYIIVFDSFIVNISMKRSNPRGIFFCAPTKKNHQTTYNLALTTHRFKGTHPYQAESPPPSYVVD